MQFRYRKTLALASVVLLAGAMAQAQPTDAIGALLGEPPAQTPSAPIPYSGQPTYAPPAAPVRQTVARPLSGADMALFRQGYDAARRGDTTNARSALLSLADPVAAQVIRWAMVDAAAERLSFYELDQARRDLAGFPRPGRRQAAVERVLETSGKSPREIVAWFEGAEPQTAQGALALAAAYRQLGETPRAQALIRSWWRDKSFEADVQRTILARFADTLTMADHIRRADILLYGAQGPAARDMIALLPMDEQAVAQARIALRSNARAADDITAGLTPAQVQTPGIAFERAAYFRRRGMESLAIPHLASFPREHPTSEQADRIWDERYRLVLYALRNNDPRAAYAAADGGLTVGGDAADSEFYAGWIALTKLKDPARAQRHFAALEQIGASPITRGRAFYWQGRAAEAQGADAAARTFYAQGAQHSTAFYGQLAAEKLGRALVLPPEPEPSAADRARFEGRDVVQATRLLFDQGQRDGFRVFALHLDDTLPSVEEAALLVDMARAYGDQDSSMKIVRAAAQRGLVMPVRGYPMRTPPQVAGGPETALTLGITRQESGFDPLVRSPVGARGMMQLMPATAQITARRAGMSYAPSMLDEPDYNMRLGQSYLGQMIGQFSGSYVMAIAAYNAGPGRPTSWTAFCGDPRGATDPLDFIECIPFSETRNYVMRVMEGMQVYRARQNGGQAPITLAADLRRGGYSYPRPTAGGN